MYVKTLVLGKLTQGILQNFNYDGYCDLSTFSAGKKMKLDFINFMERTKLPEHTFLVSLDVTSLYTNIPQGEGINTVCRAYENFYGENNPIPTLSLREILRLILQENSFEFDGKNYLQTHKTAMGPKMAVAFAKFLSRRLRRK